MYPLQVFDNRRRKLFRNLLVFFAQFFKDVVDLLDATAARVCVGFEQA
jgi:hypothetical protein